VQEIAKSVIAHTRREGQSLEPITRVRPTAVARLHRDIEVG